MTNTAKTYFPEKLVPVLQPALGTYKFRGAYGGRGSGKSVNFAQAACWHGAYTPLRILCGREFQNSIKESFYAEVESAINNDKWLRHFYRLTETFIQGRNGTKFIFKGLRRINPKSLAQIDLCILEEAEDIPEEALRKLIPTIRKKGSEIWVIWNPEKEGSPVDTRFRKNTPPRSIIVEINHQDNAFFSEELEEARAYDEQILDPDTYHHVWEGGYLKNTKAQIFEGRWGVEAFEPESYWDGPYHGLDFGFSVDPLAAVRCYIYKDVLYISHEAGKVKLELRDTAEYIEKRIPDFCKHVVRADNARPESISHLRGDGIPKITAVEKWSGSVEDGISRMRSFRKIVIHPRCVETKNEFRLYSYKIDSKTGDVLPDIVDAYNHYIDAIRYALAPIIKQQKRAGVLRGSR